MTNRESADSPVTDARLSLSKIISDFGQAAILISILTAFLYGLGCIYWRCYYSFFDVSDLVSYPRMDEAIATTWPLPIAVPLVVIVGREFGRVRRTHPGFRRVLTLVSLVAGLTCLSALWFLAGLAVAVLTALAAAVGLFVIAASGSLSSKLTDLGVSTRVMLVVGAGTCLAAMYALAGTVRAQRVALGDGHDRLTIHLSDPKEIMDGYVLVGIEDHNYVLCKPVARLVAPHVTVVPGSRIESLSFVQVRSSHWMYTWIIDVLGHGSK